MKKTLLFLFLLGSTTASAQVWQDVGATNVRSVYANTNLASDGGLLYLACNNSSLNWRVSVYVYDGIEWSLLGDSCFAKGMLNNSEMLTAMNNVPYIMTQDDQDRAIVMTYNGTNWVMVGEPLSIGEGKSVSLTHEGGILYAGYYDIVAGGVVVKKWTGTYWTILGGGIITTGISNHVSLDVENGIVYLACQENTALRVLRYEGGIWNDLGNQPVSSGYASSFHIAVEDSVIMVSYENDDNQGELIVTSYENGLWNQVGASSMPYVTGLYTNLSLLYHKPLIQFRQINGVQSVMYFQNGVWDYVGELDITSGAVTGCDLLVEGTSLSISYRDVDLNDSVYVKTYVDPLSLIEDVSSPITIYPNPVIDELWVDSDFDVLEMVVYDQHGRVLLTSYENRMNLSSLSKGAYLLKMRLRDRVHVERLIKQ